MDKWLTFPSLRPPAAESPARSESVRPPSPWRTPPPTRPPPSARTASGANCTKIGLPGKLILGDYFQDNRTSQRPFLLLRISFPGRPIFIQFIPGGNCTKIGLPGKLILRDYFQENRTSQIVCDRKRFFGETPKPKILNLNRWNFTETVITAVRDIFGRK